MADGTENILLNIEFNNDDIQNAVKNITESRKAIDQLIEANRKLVAQGEKNSAEYVKNEQAIKKLNTEVNTNSKLIQANTQAVVANENSIESLKKQNTELLKERNKLDTSTEEGRAAIVKLNEQYDKNSKVIAENSTGVEKQRFNIGNYTESIIKASEHIEKLKKENQQLTVVLKTVDRSTADGKAQYDQINTAIQNNITQINKYKVVVNQTTSSTDKATASLKQLAPGQASAVQGFIGMTRAALAFIATPIGAVVAALGLAIGALTAYFKGSEEGQDRLTKITTTLQVLFNKLMVAVEAVGEAVFESTTNFGAMTEKLGVFGVALDIALTPLKLLLLGLEKLSDLTGFTDIVNDAIKTGEAISNLNDKIEENENTLLVRRAQVNAMVLALREEAIKQEGKTKQKTVEEAIRLEKELAQAEKQQLDDRLKAFDLEAETTGRLTEEQKKQRAELVAAIIDAESQGAQATIKFQKELEKLREEDLTNAKKTSDERIKQMQIEADAARQIEQLKIDLLEEGRAKEIAFYNAAYQEKIDNLKGSDEQIAEQILLSEEKKRQDLADINDKYDEEAIQREKDRIQANNEFLADALAEELEIYQDHVQELINVKKEELLSGVISKEEYDQEIYDLELAAMMAQQALKEQFGEEDLALSGRITDAKIAQKQFEADQTVKLEALKLNAVQNTLGQVASLFNKNSVAFKALATAQTLIQTYQSAQAVFTGMTSSIPGPVGVALGVVGAAAAVAAGLANVAKINNIKTPKLEDGGYIEIGGKRHSQGGEDVHVGGHKVANVEQGENMVILKRGSSGLLRNLSNINQMVGGSNFYADRSPKKYLADGGFVARSAGSRVSNFQTISIADDLRKARFEVSVTDIEKKQNAVNRANVTSELR